MPRAEKPLEPDGGSLAAFAADLRRLREKVGSPPYRQLARHAHYSATTLSDAAGGKRLPTLAVTLAYVKACGGDEAEWERRWAALAAELSTPADPETNGERPPYVGLASFGPEDTEWFFGRERLVAQLLERLTGTRFVAIFGASGAGKSSLLRAGLLPRLGNAVVFTPGSRPLEECAIQVARLVGSTPGAVVRELSADARGLHRLVRQTGDDLVLIVDQFEEVFTLCNDQAEREAFIRALITAARADNSTCRVVLGVRADFYSHCTTLPDLVEAMGDAQLPVGPMTVDELRRAIAQPAIRAGYTIENALLADLIAHATGQAGVLPLLSHALLETWRRRRGHTLTLTGFQAAGGIDAALAQTAETVYGSLTERQQGLAKELLLRLTALGDGTEDTKRRVATAELDADNDDTAVVLERLAQARLLTRDRDTVEITHEALIRSWPRLRDWLGEDREGLRIQRQLTGAAETWESLDRDTDALYRGTRLGLARDWAQRHDAALVPREQEFLQASISAAERDQAAVRRRTIQLRWLVAALAVFLVISVVLGSMAASQRQGAVELSQVASSRQLAAEAQNLASTDVGAAIRKSLEAFQASQTVEARSTLLSLASQRMYQAKLPGPGVRSNVAMTPNGNTLAYVDRRDGMIKFWNPRTRLQSGERGGFAWGSALAFSPDGSLLAAVTRGEIVLLDAKTHTIWARITGVPSGVRKIVVSPDNRLVATASGHSTDVWDVATGMRVAPLTSGTGHDLSFSPKGDWLAYATQDGRLERWHTDRRTASPIAQSAAARFTTVAYAPDGSRLAGASDRKIILLNPETGALDRELIRHVDPVRQVAYDQTGQVLVSVDEGWNIVLWQVATGEVIAVLDAGKSEQRPAGFTLSQDGQLLAGASEDGQVLLWDRDHLPFIGQRGEISDIVFQADGGTLASRNTDGTLMLWDVRRRSVQRLAAIDGLAPYAHPTFSSDSRFLAVVRGDSVDVLRTDELDDAVPRRTTLDGYGNAEFKPDAPHLLVLARRDEIVLWDVVRGVRVDRISLGQQIDRIKYSPTGHELAVSFRSGQIVLLDGANLRTTRGLFPGGERVTSMAFNPSVPHLAVADGNSRVKIFDTRTGELATELRVHALTVAYNRDGSLLATAGDNHSVTLRHGVTFDEWATLNGHHSVVTALAWRSDGQTLASGSRDHTVIPWVIDPDEAVRGLCGVLARDYVDDGTAPAICLS